MALRPPAGQSLNDVILDTHIGGMLIYTGQLAEALDFHRAQVTRWEQHGADLPSAHTVVRHGYGITMYVLARVLQDVGQWAEAAQTARRAVTIASEFRGTPVVGMALLAEGISLHHLGELDAAKASLEEACEAFVRNPHPERHAVALLALADLAEALADPDAAHSHLVEATDIFEHLDTPTSRSMAEGLRARLDG